jgi:hypothetical protein
MSEMTVKQYVEKYGQSEMTVKQYVEKYGQVVGSHLPLNEQLEKALGPAALFFYIDKEMRVPDTGPSQEVLAMGRLAGFSDTELSEMSIKPDPAAAAGFIVRSVPGFFRGGEWWTNDNNRSKHEQEE